MFGTLKPHTCRLGCDRKQAYERFYCGLCKTLGDDFGTPSRALLSYDAVFLAVFADGLMERAAEPDRCRCPLLPVTFRPTVSPESPAMRYAAAMQLLLSDQWLADRAIDGRLLARVGRPLIAGKVESARAILAELGLSLASLEGFEERQARCEQPGITTPVEAAEPTAAALSLVFARMASLPGVTGEVTRDEGRAALAAFGRHLGRVIYLVDALDDLEKDAAGGAFNPCMARAPRSPSLRVSWERIAAAWDQLHEDLAALASLTEALPFLRHRDLLRAVTAVELPRTARAAAKRAHAFARAEQERMRVAQRSLAWPRRFAASFAAIFVFVWVWLSSIAALAKGEKRGADGGIGSTGSAAGAGDAGGASPPVEWEPRLPAPAGAGSTQQAPPAGPDLQGKGDKGSQGALPVPGKPEGPPGSAPPGAAPGSGGGGGGCGNPCSGCGNPCSDCTKPCHDCGGCCDSCTKCNQCNDCCKGCNGCDACCKGGGGGGCCCK
jgi:hypothetical protein